MKYLMGLNNAGPNLTPVLITPVSNCAEYKMGLYFHF